MEASSKLKVPRIAIEFCTQCKWNLRAAYVSGINLSHILPGRHMWMRFVWSTDTLLSTQCPPADSSYPVRSRTATDIQYDHRRDSSHTRDRRNIHHHNDARGQQFNGHNCFSVASTRSTTQYCRHGDMGPQKRRRFPRNERT